MLPFTSSFWEGVSVPIPTFCDKEMKGARMKAQLIRICACKLQQVFMAVMVWLTGGKIRKKREKRNRNYFPDNFL
jgi:hypothetical protein